MRNDESVMQFVDRVGSLGKRLAAAGKTFSEEDQIHTMLRSLPIQFFTARDLIREFEKRHSKAVDMLTAV